MRGDFNPLEYWLEPLDLELLSGRVSCLWEDEIGFESLISQFEVLPELELMHEIEVFEGSLLILGIILIGLYSLLYSSIVSTFYFLCAEIYLTLLLSMFMLGTSNLLSVPIVWKILLVLSVPLLGNLLLGYSYT